MLIVQLPLSLIRRDLNPAEIWNLRNYTPVYVAVHFAIHLHILKTGSRLDVSYDYCKRQVLIVTIVSVQIESERVCWQVHDASLEMEGYISGTIVIDIAQEFIDKIDVFLEDGGQIKCEGIELYHDAVIYYERELEGRCDVGHIDLVIDIEKRQGGPN